MFLYINHGTERTMFLDHPIILQHQLCWKLLSRISMILVPVFLIGIWGIEFLLCFPDSNCLL